jgi:hypothetical protein
MVQDIFDPEYFAGVCEEVNTITKEKVFFTSEIIFRPRRVICQDRCKRSLVRKNKSDSYYILVIFFKILLLMMKYR